MAFYSLEPWGERVAYHRAGIVASAVVNMMSGKSARRMTADMFVPEDPDFRPKGERVADDVKRVMMGKMKEGGE